ncbi:TPA: hypothetical protein ACWSGK_005179, partial [Escherichia coli]
GNRPDGLNEPVTAAGRLEKIRRQNRTKAELQAVLDGK